MKKLVLFSLCFLTTSILGQTPDERANTPVPFTLADRDRLIKLEVQVDAMNDRMTKLETTMDDKITKLEATMNDKFDTARYNVDARINSLERLMYIMIAGIFGLIGFTVWDRRTFHLKLEKRVESLEQRSIIYSPK